MTSNRARSRVKVNKTANIRCHKYKNDIMKNLIDNRFIDCEDIPENTAIYDLNTKVLRQGKTKLSYKQIKRIAFILATDLKNFAETGVNFSNLTANEVYSHLQSNQ